jgi:ubiquinone/menaquinone biosynthesis C-methylase UbiE
VADNWIWDRYWRSGRVASCLDEGGTTNYVPAVAEGWTTFFAKLGDGRRILDLCTGNGAIAIFAAEAAASAGKRFTIIGVDAANIDPKRFVSRFQDALSDVEFKAQTPVESLPFADGEFDAVVSQYGIEYSQITQSVPEAMRVLAPHGKARFVVHAAEGLMAANARRALDDLHFLIDEVDLVGRAVECFEQVTLAERRDQPSPEANASAKQAVVAFEAALSKVGQRMLISPDSGMLRNSGATLIDLHQRRGQLSLEELTEQAEAVEVEWLAYRGRLNALLNSALMDGQCAAIAKLLRENGAIDASHAPVVIEGNLIGYAITAQK